MTRAMTRAELEQKWTREHFEEIKAQGFSSPGETYENYLAMRCEQEELRAQQLQQIVADYGALPNEEPPDEMEGEDLFARTLSQKKLSEFFAESPLAGVELDLTR